MSKYQHKVNSLLGALGPTTTAYWKPMTSYSGNTWDLDRQPLYWSASAGKYITSYDMDASKSSVDFASGFGRKKLRRGKSRRKSKNFGRRFSNSQPNKDLFSQPYSQESKIDTVTKKKFHKLLEKFVSDFEKDSGYTTNIKSIKLIRSKPKSGSKSKPRSKPKSRSQPKSPAESTINYISEKIKSLRSGPKSGSQPRSQPRSRSNSRPKSRSRPKSNLRGLLF